MPMRTRTIRLSESILNGIKLRAEREDVDEATALRQSIKQGLSDYAVMLYRDGKVTLEEAAELADVSIRRMLERLWEHGVKGNVTIKQQLRAIEYVKKMVG